MILVANVFFSGVKCPTIKRDPDDPKKEVADPFAAEAKFFVESRLLQRDVKIILEGVSNQNILLATVLHPVSYEDIILKGWFESKFLICISKFEFQNFSI